MGPVDAQLSPRPEPAAKAAGTPLLLNRVEVATAVDAGTDFTIGRSNGKTLSVALARVVSGLLPARLAVVSATRNGLASFVSTNLSVSPEGEVRWSDVTPGYFGNWQVRIRAEDPSGRIREIVVPVNIALPPNTPPPCEQGGRPWCGFLLERWTQGQAAGNLEDFYNNRDAGHANYPVAGLSRQIRVLAGGSATMFFPWPTRNVVGNGSLFFQGPLAANMERYHSFTVSDFNAKVRVYESNHVFWYPAHTDIFGSRDLFHYNAAYSNMTVGSSGSELADVANTFIVWAAFRPDVKVRLVERGLLAPVTQMLLRRNRVESNVDYLSGAAHPSGMSPIPASIVERKALELAQAANEITVQDIPPLARLRVVREDFSAESREQLATNAWGVHRIWRSEVGRREVVLSAEDSVDFNGRPLRFHWSVLRGHDWARIEPLDPAGRSVRLVLDYPQRYQYPPVRPGGETNWTTRLDIGLFANNGPWYSPPAIFTVYALDAEERAYNRADGRLLSSRPTGRGDHPRLK